jgi:hypothetical protein
MTTELAEGAILVAPLFVGFATHGICIRLGALRGLAMPIWRSALGANKTYRGVLCVALGTAVGFAAISPWPVRLGEGRQTAPLVLFGFVMGTAAMVAELPNSLLKRRLGIAPGAQAGGVRGIAFHVLDQIDVVLGAWAVLAWVVKPSWGRVAGSLGSVYVGHQLVSLLGYWLGMRATAR